MEQLFLSLLQLALHFKKPRFGIITMIVASFCLLLCCLLPTLPEWVKIAAVFFCLPILALIVWKLL